MDTMADNGAAQTARQDTRAERQTVWRLAVWQARAAAQRLAVIGAQDDAARLRQIMAGAVEGAPPARLEPSAVAHESRGLHGLAAHKSGIGIVRGAPAHRRGSLDPRSVLDLFRGQGLPQTRSDYAADRATTAVLQSGILRLRLPAGWQRAPACAVWQRAAARLPAPRSAADWQTAAQRAARACAVWQRYVLRLPQGQEAQRAAAAACQDSTDAAPQAARLPALQVWQRALPRLRKAQELATAAQRLRLAGNCAPRTAADFQARLDSCACAACAAHLRGQRQRAAHYLPADAAPLPARAPEPDCAPWLDWNLRAARLRLAARLRSAQADRGFRGSAVGTAQPQALPELRQADPRQIVAAACGKPVGALRLAPARRAGKAHRLPVY